ncbi:phosphotransferase family protein [Salinispora arenicola]|uniref:phosphotransferase family protein n=1 Tax=Salinispora arenicola TaxID=168697 RepID=UPI0003713838|nr:aminoglycoside phosphotransferase family protein [Salinispora arenicola]MCN0150497.1 aminoglycoside phosphotransferase family protein [Salinispora arenicola]
MPAVFQNPPPTAARRTPRAPHHNPLTTVRPTTRLSVRRRVAASFGDTSPFLTGDLAVPYDTGGMPSSPPRPVTTRRPGWSDLPVGMRAALADRLGAPVVATRTATAGFTRGFAGVLTAADGSRAFVKAAPHDSRLASWYGWEAAILDRLPSGLPAPRTRWTLADSSWFAIALDVVDGYPPRRPWEPSELASTLTAYAGVAAALDTPPNDLAALNPPHLADLAQADILRWGDVAAGREPAPPFPAGLEQRLPELVGLESRLPGYVASASSLIHGDLRPDNVLFGPDGQVWFCDWTWLCRGPAWFDLVTLLLGGHAAGDPEVTVGPLATTGGTRLPAGPTRVSGPEAAVAPAPAVTTDWLDAAFAAHPAAANAPPDALDVTLAALAGYFLTTPTLVPDTATEQFTAHQRRSGEYAFAWLACRQGWS